MKPLADTLNLLQGEKNVSIGYLLPSIHNLLHRYRDMANARFKYCNGLVTAILASIKKRYVWLKISLLRPGPAILRTEPVSQGPARAVGSFTPGTLTSVAKVLNLFLIF